MKTQRQTPLFALAAATALVAGCSQQNVYQPPPPPSVTVSKPLQQDVTVYLEETGTTEPFQYVDVRARVKGFLISDPELLAILEGELLKVLKAGGPDRKESDIPLLAILQKRADSGGDEASEGDLRKLLEERASSAGEVATGAGPDVSEVWLLQTLMTRASRKEAGDEVAHAYLKENYFLPGAEVKAGDQLYQIDPQPYLAALRQALAALNVANAEYIDADAKYQRGIPLVKDGAMSREEFGERAAVKGVKAANIKAAQAAVTAARLDLEYTRVMSPIDGRVGKTLVYKGNLVGATDATLLTNVVRYAPIYATFNISENKLLRLQATRETSGAAEREKKDVKMFLRRANDKDFRFPGQLDFKALTVDERTGTYQIRGVFGNPGEKIVPGLFVRIRAPLGDINDALLVPQRAIAQDQQGKYLLIVNNEKKVERRDVALGRTLRDFVVVADGLKADETVIIDGIQRARPGAEVTPEPIVLEAPEPEVIQQENDATSEDGSEPSPSPAAGTAPEIPGAATVEPPTGLPAVTTGGAPAGSPGGTTAESPGGALPAAPSGTAPAAPAGTPST